MLVKLILFCALSSSLNSASSDLSFRNVMLTCDSQVSNPDEIDFGTIVTTNRIKPHLPNEKCYKIAIQHATIPVLHEDALSDINNANFLVLENDHIEELEPGAFRNVKLGEGLSLQSNKIKEIRRGVFNDVQVPILFLSHNQISYIDYQAFDNMTLLESIHLDHNKLTRINTFWFKNTPKLNKINLQHNLIQEIPANTFQNLIIENFNAPEIDLSNNLIRKIDRNAMTKLKKLRRLNVANNLLSNLNRGWLKGVEIDVLDLSNNKFRCLSYGLAEPYSTNFIDRNPWDCSCLEEIKKKEMRVFGNIVADQDLRRCNISPRYAK